jgi:hypothetical protein
MLQVQVRLQLPPPTTTFTFNALLPGPRPTVTHELGSKSLGFPGPRPRPETRMAAGYKPKGVIPGTQSFTFQCSHDAASPDGAASPPEGTMRLGIVGVFQVPSRSPGSPRLSSAHFYASLPLAVPVCVMVRVVSEYLFLRAGTQAEVTAQVAGSANSLILRRVTRNLSL